MRRLVPEGTGTTDGAVCVFQVVDIEERSRPLSAEQQTTWRQ